MSARQQGPYDTIARKWLALAERRRAHLIELRDSGRWKRYYRKGDLAEELLVLELACRRFAEVAGSEPEPEAAAA
jgi:DNA-binding transcriptional ArsR family regulator